jgi:restriction system protein
LTKRRNYRPNLIYTTLTMAITPTRLIPPHGGYKNLLSYQSATIVYDLTVEFCERYMSYKTNKSYRTYDQMVQAARSGKQNIAEGSQASGTSKKTELKLIGVARASQAELLADYEDYLRQHGFLLWAKDDSRVREVRALAYKSNKSFETYRAYMADPTTAANCAIVLIHQTNYLLDRQLATLEKKFLEEGGFTERLYSARRAYRSNISQRHNIA